MTFKIIDSPGRVSRYQDIIEAFFKLESGKAMEIEVPSRMDRDRLTAILRQTLNRAIRKVGSSDRPCVYVRGREKVVYLERVERKSA